MTPSPIADARDRLATFMQGGAFLPFWTAVMDASPLVDQDGTIPDADRDWYDELYELVYTAAEDEEEAQRVSDGGGAADALRTQIREFHLDG